MNKIIIGIIIVVLVGLGIGLAKGRNNDTSTATTNTSSSSQTKNNTSPKPTGENEVSIIHMNFSPASMSIKKGTTVKWINNDNVSHTVTEKDSKSGPKSGTLNPGDTYSFTFNESGVFTYYCSIHPDMMATVTVRE